MSDPILYILLAIPLAALRDVGLAHWHLHRKIEPDPWRRFFGALFQYGSVLAVWFSIWAVMQSASALLFSADHPLIPIVLSTASAFAINRWVLRKPTAWRGRPPLLSKDRAYDGFLRIVADRASEARGKPEERQSYLDRLYRDDPVRLQVIAAYLNEHRGSPWIALRPHQLAYHPGYNRLRWTLLYLLAIAPVIVPFALSVIEPTITAENVNLTAVAAFAGTLLYGPLFEPQTRNLLFGLAAVLVLGMGIMMEFERSRAAVPGFAGLLMLCIFAVFAAHYVQNYVVEQADTPLMRVTDYLLAQIQEVDGRLRKFGPAAKIFGYREEAQTITEYSRQVRQAVLGFQSAAGSLFILPALLFWGGLSFAAIWEMYFSDAADVTFKHRMRKPAL